MNQVIKRWQQNDRWFKVVGERETFRFGNGETLPSKYGVLLQATFAGHDVILNFSVVQGDCPPLLSRPACTQLGAIFDCSQHMLSSRRLGVKQYGLTQTQSGHYTMCIEEFGENSLQVSLPHDFAWKAGDEVYIWKHEQPVLALQSFGSDHRDRDCGIDAHGDDPCPTLPSMRRSRPSDEGMSVNSVRRRSTSAYEGRHRHGWNQRGQFAEEVEASGGEGHDSGSQGVSPPTRRRRKFSMDGGARDTGARGVPSGRRERALSHGEGEGDDHEEAREGQSIRGEEDRDQGVDRYAGRLPVAQSPWSAEVPFNVVGSVKARMIAFMWKKVVWQLRMKNAVETTFPGARWKKNKKWLGMLFGKEVAAMWGHFGAMRQRLHAPIGPSGKQPNRYRGRVGQ